MNINKEIRNLLTALPHKDTLLCINLLDKRDYDTILEIVDSDITIIKNTYGEDLSDAEQLHLSDLLKLKGLVEPLCIEDDVYTDDYEEDEII